MTLVLPLYVLLIFYLVIVFGYGLGSVFIIYHLFRFGFNSLGNFFLIFIYVGVSVMMLFASWQAISQIDWLQQVTIMELGQGLSFF